jgi:uncharacterized damage-inducible protein DinB
MLIEGLKKQFSNAFDVLEGAIRSFSPDQWQRGSPPFNGPARAAIHVLQCAEFYTNRDRSVFANFGKPVQKMNDQEVPSQKRVLEHATRARAMTVNWIDTLGDAGLANRASHDESITALEAVAYALRHLQHHTGELCAYQKQCGLEPAPWK